jgi:ribosomal protein L11 methyltransferase
MLVGESFFLVAPWREDPTPIGRLRLEITPGMACGTGRHPATQLCLEALESYARPGDFVLDVGTGSGILSAAARLLGASTIVSCDIDSAAISVARERLDSALFVGTADAVRGGVADIVLANIDSAAIEHLSAEFARVRKPLSTLIVSGFPHWDLPEGFQPRQILRREDWVCYVA